jgi:hypothetical protein
MLTNATLLRIDDPSPGPDISVRCSINPPTQAELAIAEAMGWAATGVLYVPTSEAGLGTDLAAGQVLVVQADGRPSRDWAVLGVVDRVGGLLSFFQVFAAIAS